MVGNAWRSLSARGTLLAAGAAGLLAALLGYGSIKLREREARAGWELVEVLVAAEDAAEGRELTAAAVETRAVPEQFVTGSVVRPANLDVVLGQRLEVPVRKGDPILWTHFETAKGFEKLSAAVESKGRAVTISVGEVGSVGGWVRPNDHVDVVATLRDPDSQDSFAVTLLENVIVLATGETAAGQRHQGRVERAGDVSLLVLPEEAELLVLAQELGTLSLTLRNPQDVEVEGQRDRATIETLVTGERAKELQRLRYQTIQVIRGGASQQAGIAP